MPEPAAADPDARRVLLVAGPVKPRDRTGHHDYLGGCRLLATLLSRVPGIVPVVVNDGWPTDESLFETAHAVVFYDKGDGKQGFLATAQRIRCLERLVSRGAGVVVLHQAVAFPADKLQLGLSMLGGVYASGVSQRGHWRSTHSSFPAHPVTRGAEPWKIRDGWLNHIRFVEDRHGLTPLLWSGRRAAGSSEGGDADVVAWSYERPSGGRSFVFTGLDAHSAWSHAGLRRMVVAGVLWAAGVEIPAAGPAVDIESTTLDSFLTPRRSWLAGIPRKLIRRLAGSPRW